MTQDHKLRAMGQPEPKSRLVLRLLRDETGVTTLEYVVAGASLAIAGVGACRLIGGVLVNIVHRVYLVVTLTTP